MNQLLKYLAVMFLVTAGQSVTAADEFDVTKKPIGAVTTWQAHNGKISVTYQGESRGLHKFKFVRDNSKGEPLRLTSWSNRNGDTVRVRIGSAVIKYIPHDCSLTRGTCHYEEKHSKLGTRRGQWVAKVKNGVWHYDRRIWHEGAWVPFESGTFTVEKSGYAINRDFTFWEEDGKTFEKGWLRRVK